MPPLGSSKFRRRAELLVERFHQRVELGAQAAVNFGTCEVKCGAQYSASTICSSAPDPASVFSASMRDSIAQGATMKPTRNAGAIDLENEPM